MSLMSNFTSIPSGGNVVEYLFAFDHALNGYAVFTLLLAMIIVVVL